MIPNDTITDIIETARIEEVVSDFVTLKKRGANLLGLCPFHNEKTPSFTVSPVKGIYKCFGCGKAGNSIRFMMDHDQLSYPDALRYLAKKYNIELEEEEQTPQQIAAANEKESLYIVSKFAADFFKETLHDNDAGKAIGLSYFQERGFTPETIEKFQLGYSVDEWDHFTKAALEKGYKLEYLEKTGLTIVKEQNKQFDRFKGRVIFPIHNVSGRVIGFGGRTLKSDKKIAKYLNSPESDIYHKSKVLYGMYFAKKAITQLNNCYLVEGYTDVISLHQSNLENVVASSGTSLTSDQIRLIKRYTNNITILFDSDAAGIKASFRGIEMILEAGMNVKVVLFPEGEDPDSYSKKLSPEELKSYAESNAQDFIQFKTKLLSEGALNDPIKKAELIKETIKTISLIPDAITRSVYTKECSNLIQIEEQVLINELNKIRRKKIAKEHKEEKSQYADEINTQVTAPKQVDKGDITPWELREKDIIRLLLKHGSKSIQLEIEQEDGETEKITTTLQEFIIHELQNDNISFENSAYDRIYREYIQLWNEEKQPEDSHFIHHENEEISATAIDVISSKYQLANWEGKNIYPSLEEDMLLKSIEKYLCYYKLAKVKDMIRANEQIIKNNITEEESTILLKKQANLLKAKIAIASRLGMVTTS